jgi:hypothetical protein
MRVATCDDEYDAVEEQVTDEEVTSDGKASTDLIGRGAHFRDTPLELEPSEELTDELMLLSNKEEDGEAETQPDLDESDEEVDTR